MLSSITIVLSSFFINAQTTSPILLITDKEDGDVYSTYLASDVLDVQSQDQALYRDTADMLTFISNSNASGGTNRIRFWQFRGVGESSQYENTPTHSITSLVDGVDITGMMSHWPLLDVERVRVEKQPASILYGGNAVGGVVDTTLVRSSDEWKWRGTMDSRLGFGADASVPLRKHRLSLHYNKDNGYIKNTLLDESGNSRREVYGSLVSDWVDSGPWSVRTSVLAAHFFNRYDVWSISNNLETSSDRPGQDNLNMVGGSLTARYDVSSDARMHFWSSVAQSKSYYSYDADWSNNIYWNTIPGWNANYDYFDDFLRYRTQWHSRLSLEWKDWIWAVHASSIREDSDARGFKNGFRRSLVVGNFKQNSVATHATYKKNITDNILWTTSGRADIVQTNYHDDQGLSENWHHPDGAVSTQLEWNINSEHKMYTSFRRGYKNPIVNIDPDTPAIRRRVDSESVFHAEIGHAFARSRSYFSQSVFFRRGDNQQVRVSDQIDINDPSSYVYYYDNAAKTNYMGYEIQGHMQWGDGQIKASLGFLRARFQDYVFDGQILTGRELAHAPKSTWAIQWLEPISQRWSVITQIEGKSSFYYSNNHGKKNADYGLLHVAVRFQNKKQELDIGVRNLLDRAYGIRAFYFANEPPDFTEKLYEQRGVPRTVYVNYRVTFDGF